MAIDHQWDNLMILAEAAAYVQKMDEMADRRRLEDEKKNKKGKSKISIDDSSSLADHQNGTKLRRITFTFGRVPAPEQNKKKSFVPNKNGASSSSSSVNEVARVSEIPAAMREAIAEDGGGEFFLVAQKELFKSDVERNKNRLSMPNSALRAKPEEFLNEEECLRVKEPAGLAVTAVDEELRKYKLILKEWNMGKNQVYNLIAKWNSLVENNALAKDDVVQIWGFRRRGLELGFAVVKKNGGDVES